MAISRGVRAGALARLSALEVGLGPFGAGFPGLVLEISGLGLVGFIGFMGFRAFRASRASNFRISGFGEREHKQASNPQPPRKKQCRAPIKPTDENPRAREPQKPKTKVQNCWEVTCKHELQLAPGRVALAAWHDRALMLWAKGLVGCSLRDDATTVVDPPRRSQTDCSDDMRETPADMQP